MNLLQAIESGKPFRRDAWTHADWIVHGGKKCYGGGEFYFLSSMPHNPSRFQFTYYNDFTSDDYMVKLDKNGDE